MFIYFFIIPILIFIILGIFSETKFNKLFVIKKGNHYDNKIFIRYFLFFKKREFKFNVSFDSSWRYKIEGEDKWDINKIIGFGFLPTHEFFSIRFGARYNPNIDKVEIIAYAHVKKIMVIPVTKTGEIEVLANCLMNNSNYTLILEIDKENYTLSVELDGEKCGPTSIIAKKHKQFFAYALKPYFGGNKTAPQTINTKIERIK